MAKKGTMNIYVGNLSLETTEPELRKKFAEFGEVISVTVMNNKYIGSSQPRGYGYVEMASKSEGAAAIANLEGKKLRSRVINVIEALPLSNKGRAVSPNIRSSRPNKKRRRGYIIN